jgi:hypothetical protein
MPKERVNCRNCLCFEGARGMKLALCWRPYEGPQVIESASSGFCGDEWTEDSEDEGEARTPRELWMAWHKHTPDELAQVEQLLKLGSVGRPGRARPAGGKD